MASKGLTIALIGCAVIVFGGVVAVLTGGYFLKRAVTSKLETVKKVAGNMAGSEDSEYGKKVAELKKDYPFTAPSDGIVSESQLNRFIAVRRSVYNVYKQHEAEFNRMANDKENALKAMMELGTLFNQVKLTQANALVEQHMSPDEYQYLVTNIYRTWWAKQANLVTQGQSFSQATTDQWKQQLATLDQQLQQTNLTEDQKKVLQQQRDAIQTQLDNISKSGPMQQMNAVQDVPKANLELFAKHEKEIQQYSMAGLEFIGL